MSDTEFRHGKKRFYDNTKFPRGFAKSGDFTLAEEEILTIYGDTMLGLETGELSPQNAEEKHFVKVIENLVKQNQNLSAYGLSTSNSLVVVSVSIL